MIMIAGKIRLDPAKQEQATRAAVAMTEASRAEPGCVDYAFTWDLLEPGVLRVIEQWQDQDALDLHFKAPPMATFTAAMGDLGVTEMDVTKYEIAKAGPVF